MSRDKSKEITLASLEIASNLLDQFDGDGCAIIRPHRGRQCVIIGRNGKRDVSVYNASGADPTEVTLSKRNQKRWNRFFREARSGS